MGEAVVQRDKQQLEVLQRNSGVLKKVHEAQLIKAIAGPRYLAMMVLGLVIILTFIFVVEHVSRSVSGVLMLAYAVLALVPTPYIHWSLRSNLTVDTANAECGNEDDRAMIEAKLVSNPLACLLALTVGGLVQADSGGFDELDSIILQLRMAEGWTNWKIRGVWGLCLVLALIFLYPALRYFVCSSNGHYSDDGSWRASDLWDLWDDSCYNTPTTAAPTPSGCSMMGNASVWRDSDGENCLWYSQGFDVVGAVSGGAVQHNTHTIIHTRITCTHTHQAPVQSRHHIHPSIRALIDLGILSPAPVHSSRALLIRRVFPKHSWELYRLCAFTISR